MSSNTTFGAEPAEPAPPPIITSVGQGHQATSTFRILGPNGCTLLRATLADLASAGSPLLRELTDGVVLEPATQQDLDGWARGWERESETRFRRVLDSATVFVETGGTALETSFRFDVTDTRARTPQELAAQAQPIQRQVNRIVNKVLALTVSKLVIQPQIREKLKVAQPVAVRAANRATVRLTCFAPVPRS